MNEWPERFSSKVDIRSKDECWPWLGCKSSNGYGMYWHQGRMHHSHRMAINLRGEEAPQDKVVMHHCDNRICCNPYHLKVADQFTNIADAHHKGRAPIGESHGMHILSEDDVRAIRTSPLNAAKAAEKYGVAKATIHGIRQRKSWRHI